MMWQLGTMLHPGAQQREHRKNVSAHHVTWHAETTTTWWQSGHQHGAHSQHHLGDSFRLVRGHHTHCRFTNQINLNPLSEKWGEDQDANSFRALVISLSIISTPFL
jgi:hypothetical protein